MQKIYSKILTLIALMISFTVQAVHVHIIPSQTSGCVNTEINFHSTASAGVTYNWYIDGYASPADSASHIFFTPGIFNVTLTVDSAGYTASDTVVITINPGPTVHFTADDTAVCPGELVTFTDVSTPNAPGGLRQHWDFGDGTYSNAAMSSHTYSMPGYYSISLTDTNSNGCITVGTVGHYVHIYDLPEAVANSSTYLICNTPGSLTVSSATTGFGPFTCAWTFGDGGTATGTPVTHTYTTPATYTIILIATDAHGCNDTVTVPRTIYVDNSGFIYSPYACINTPTTFIDTTRFNWTSTKTWDFGDGTVITVPAGSDTLSHTYTAPGVYTVVLTAPMGFTYGNCVTTHTVTVSPFLDTFTISPVHLCAEPDTLTYNGVTHYGDTIRWVFGDHGTATGDTVSHIFVPGALDSVFRTEGCSPVYTYVLNRTTMYVTDVHGCRDTIRRIDTMYNMLFDIKPTSWGGCASFTDTFSVSAKTTVPYLYPPGPYPYPITSYLWNFGDGSPTVTTAAPAHTFVSTGIYSVTCTITTSNGCTYKDTIVISVGSHPVISYHAAATSLCYGALAILTADTSASPVHIDHLVWNYGDGTKDSTVLILTTTHDFLTTGNLPVKLTAYNQGCAASYTDTIRVHPPKAAVSIDYNCLHTDSFTLHNTSTGASSSIWLLPGGLTATGTNLTYVTSTTAVIRLATYNATWGCRDTLAITLRSIDLISSFTASDTTLCHADRIYFASSTDTTGSVFKYSWWLNHDLVHVDSAMMGCGGMSFPAQSAFYDSITHIGIDTMRLVVTDIHGCSDTITRHLYLTEPAAAFTATPIYGCSPLSVVFRDTTVAPWYAPIDSVIWRFGDGTYVSSTNDTVHHLYTFETFAQLYDTFSVTAIVTNSFGCIDSFKKNKYILVSHPQARMSNSTIFCKDVSVQTSHGLSTATGSYFYDYGNGDTLSTSYLTPYHTYHDTGNFTLRFVVIDTVYHCRDTATINAVVTRPDAAFALSDSFFTCPPFAVDFINMSARATSYNWDLADGSPSTEVNPGHTYASSISGVLNIKLIATDAQGCKDTAIRQLHLMDSLGGFTYPGMGCSPLVEHFIPVIGYADSLKWEFGDLVTQMVSSADTINHVYQHPGMYIPRIVIYKHGCPMPSNGVDTIKVDSTHAAFNFSPNPACPYSPVTFSSTSTSIYSPVNSWHWSFSITDTTSIVTHAFSSTGTIPVTLSVSTAWNCSDTETHNLTVYGHILSAGLPIMICPGGSTVLTASGGSGLNWYPATGLSCTSCASPNAHPTATTTYRVTGTNTHGCSDTAFVTVTVAPQPVVTITNSSPFICVGQFSNLAASGASTYTWSPSGSLSSGAGSLVTATPLVTTSYIVTGTDTNGCTDTAMTTVTVYSLPTVTVSASPSAFVCAGSSTVLTASGATSYSWIPSGSLSSGVGSPVTATPTSTTNYVVTGTDGHSCQSTANITITVYERPTISLIGNTGPQCVGNNILLYDTVTGGSPAYTYSWTGPSSYTSAAHNPLLTSVTAGMTGWYVLTVTDAHGCSRKDSTFVNVSTATAIAIIGDSTICIGDTTVLSVTPASGMSFSWSPTGSLSCPTCATTNAYPTTTTAYVVTATNILGCVSTATRNVTVHPLPYIPAIQGERHLCAYEWDNLTDTLFGGVWTASGSVSLMSSATGFTLGTSAGTGIVTYTYTNSNGCTNYDTFLINVHGLPPLAPPVGDSIICLGSTATYTDSIAGGYWISIADDINLVDSFGHVTTVDTGIGGVRYFYTDTFGCSSSIDAEIYVAPAPILAGIAHDTVCVHDSVIVITSTPGGVWTIADSSIATVGSTGFIIGTTAGTTLITYTVTNSFGCSSEVHNFFTVMAIPDTPVVTGPDTMCVNTGETFTTSIPGGVWQSSNPSVAMVDTTGYVFILDTGTVSINYILSNWHCSTIVTHPIHIITTPFVPPITGEHLVCIGDTIILSDPMPGGYWFTADSGIVIIDSFGVVTGMGEGTTMVAYVVHNTCGYGYALDTVTSISPTPPITGVLAVCSGSVTTLSNPVPGGIWSSSDTTVATVDTAGVVTGVGYGTTTITYTATGPCGTFTVTVNVMVDMAPIITTNFLVACQTMSDGGVISSKHTAMGEPSGGGPVIEDGDGCLKVCENTTVRYYGHGVAGSHFTWTCVGGTIVGTYGANNDSIDVLWPAAGIVGSIIVNDTFSHCIGQAELCIRVISKPHADFTASTVAVCLGDAIAFYDASVADTLSPIAGWYWDFGDGTSFGDQFPPPHVYGTPGTYYVTLVVWNACHCADSFQIKITVDENPGPQIHCPAIVCENEVATYSIDDPCDPEWEVIGGTIVDGDGTGTITVKWDDAPADGHGYVQVTNTCGDCNLPSIVQVPIILNNAPITGPAFACASQQYTYSLPLWAATDYEWGVLGYPGIIMGYNNDHQMTVVFPGPGTYTIHAWYQNRLKLCGGNVTKTVVVKEMATISGPTRVCVNDSTDYGYSLSGGHTGLWVVRNPFGVETTTSSAYSSTSVLFNIPGVWLINAIGDFCVNPVNVYVDGIPAAIDSVVGEDTVCLNRIYTYKAFNDVPGTTYEWLIIGGNVLPASGSETVDVVWTSAGTKKLMVRHEPNAEPHCDAPVFVYNVIQEQINPAITGDTAPCANAHRWYNSHYNRGDAYDWSIYPDSVGSVVEGYHSADARVLWNNVVAPTTGYVIVKTQKCDTSVSDTFRVTVQPPPPVFITTDTSVICPGTGVTFTSNGIADSCIWDFGDGTTVHAIGGDVFHHYPLNLTSDNITYTVRVAPILGADPYCPTAGIGFYHITVLPGPMAHISIASGGAWCPPTTSTLYGVVTDNIGTSTYEWFRNGVAIPSSNVVDYTASASYGESFFKMVVTSVNGCTDTSNTIRFYSYCDPGDSALPGGYLPPPDTGLAPGSCHTDSTYASITHGCNTITLTGSTSGLPRWYAFTKPEPGDGWTNYPAWSYINSSSAIAHYDTPGIYRFAYVATYLSSYYGPEGCKDTVYFRDTIGIVPRFRTQFKCGPGNTDTVVFTDYSAHLSWWLPTSHTWSDGIGGTGSGITFTGIYNAGTVITMNQTVSGTQLGNPFSCSDTKSVHLPPRLPHFGYTFSSNNICSEIPVTFTPATTAGVASFLWQFGNDGSNRLVSPSCSYSFNGPAPSSPFLTTMTVTDTIGCVFDTSMGTVTVYANNLRGSMDPGSVLCPNDVPFSISYSESPGSTSPTSYAWSNGDSTFIPYTDVYNSGAYTVKVYDGHQCRFVPLNVENVKVLRVPTAQIRGRLNYCANELIQLNGYAGHSVSYQWYIDGATFAPIDHVSFYEPAGTYTVTLVLSMYDTADGVPCTDTAVAILHVLPAPDPPVITGPTIVDCDLYHLQLHATASEAGTFNWSNADAGPTANVYTGGPIGVTFTNMAGCSSSAQVLIPSSPAVYFQYLPSGCYDICSDRFPITLYGPPNVSFDSWEWRKDGTIESSGSGIMDPYSVAGTGGYQWVLGNGLCDQKSPSLDITSIHCDRCEKLDIRMSVDCDWTNPVCYKLNLTIVDPGIGDVFTVGTDGGPVLPFSGTISTFSTSLNLSLAVIDTDATEVIVYVEITHVDGTKCLYKQRVKLPECSWIAEKPVISDTTKQVLATVSTAMLVYPNPATQMVTISYDYGDQPFKERSIAVFDPLGRKMQSRHLDESHGSWQLNTTDWSPGVYIIRMEADGKALQTQRLIVNN